MLARKAEVFLISLPNLSAPHGSLWCHKSVVVSSHVGSELDSLLTKKRLIIQEINYLVFCMGQGGVWQEVHTASENLWLGSKSFSNF